MSLSKKQPHSKAKPNFFDQQMSQINKIRRKKNQLTAENINLILDRHFLTLELIKFNLFGEDFENYGNIVINGETYYPYKLNLDYLAKQQSDDVKLDLHIDVDILNSLKKADDASKVNLRNFSRNSIKRMTTSRYSKMLIKNNSMENIKVDKYRNLMGKDLPLPKIKKFNPHKKIDFASNYMKLILLKNFPEPLSSINSKDFVMRKNSYLKRHGKAIQLKRKLNILESKYKNIESEIKNNELINKEKTPQFQFRYKYVESKFKV